MENKKSKPAALPRKGKQEKRNKREAIQDRKRTTLKDFNRFIQIREAVVSEM